MSRDKSKKRKQDSAESRGRVAPGRPARKRWVWLVIALVLVTTSVAAAAFIIRARNAQNSQSNSDRGIALAVDPATPDTAWDPAWSPLPKYGGALARPIEQVRAAYAFAARRGDVLQYMPCYCGCEKQGHKSDESCFIKGKTAAGAPQWDSMGISCTICLDVAHETMQMYSQGKPLIEIRQALDAKYKTKFGTTTPTDYPPANGQ